MDRSFEFSFDDSELNEKLKEFLNKFNAALEMYSETEAKVLEGYAKENRPWTDRTGDARKRLTGSTEPYETGIKIVLSHGVNYGIWLELAHEKRFAILEPTIRLKGSEVVRGLKRMFRSIHMK